MKRVLVILAVVVSVPSFGASDLGATLPENARQVGEHRYKSPSDWEGTL